MVWSNERVIKWIQSIGLKEYANNLIDSGVHGGVLAFDESYDWQQMALALEIPMHDQASRQLLHAEFNNLIATATQRNVASPAEHANSHHHHPNHHHHLLHVTLLLSTLATF